MAEPRSEEYNGWTNRETWAAALHLNNTEWLQAEAIEHAGMDEWGDSLGEWVGELFQDVIDGSSPLRGLDDVRLMVTDVGSLWRVNWKEIRDSLLEE